MNSLVHCSKGHAWECSDPAKAECPECGELVCGPATGQPQPTTQSYVAGKEGTARPVAVVGVTPSAQEKAPRLPAVPGYEMLSELGRGGMGVVYKARHIQLGRTVALKMILAGGHAGEADLARFRAEAAAVARLQHPHIVQIFEIGEHNRLPYFSLEFVEDGSLDRKLNGLPLHANAAARLTSLLAEAIQAAHEKGILHRDLKPANILLARSDSTHGVLLGNSPAHSGHYQPKIGDFGLAKMLGAPPSVASASGSEVAAASALTATGVIMGTPSYMAPEQASGRNTGITASADVYALGAVLYELLTARPPFRAATTLETLKQVVENEPVPPRQLNGQTPRDLETICLKCLHKEPARRYASARELAADLERHLAGRPILARPAGRVERTWRLCRRNPVVASLLAAVFAVLVAGTTAATIFAISADRNAATARAKERLARQETSAKEDALERVEQERDDKESALKQVTKARDDKGKAIEKLERNLANSNVLLAQSAFDHNDPRLANDLLDRVPAKLPVPLRFFEWHYLKRRFEGGIYTLYGHTDEVTALAFSPDGARYAPRFPHLPQTLPTPCCSANSRSLPCSRRGCSTLPVLKRFDPHSKKR